jgi:hypothetical protein
MKRILTFCASRADLHRACNFLVVKVVFRVRESDPERAGRVFLPAQIGPPGPLWREVVGVTPPAESIEFVCDPCCIRHGLEGRIRDDEVEGVLGEWQRRGRIDNDSVVNVRIYGHNRIDIYGWAIPRCRASQ